MNNEYRVAMSEFDVFGQIGKGMFKDKDYEIIPRYYDVNGAIRQGYMDFVRGLKFPVLLKTYYCDHLRVTEVCYKANDFDEAADAFHQEEIRYYLKQLHAQEDKKFCQNALRKEE